MHIVWCTSTLATYWLWNKWGAGKISAVQCSGKNTCTAPLFWCRWKLRVGQTFHSMWWWNIYFGGYHWNFMERPGWGEQLTCMIAIARMCWHSSKARGSLHDGIVAYTWNSTKAKLVTLFEPLQVIHNSESIPLVFQCWLSMLIDSKILWTGVILRKKIEESNASSLRVLQGLVWLCKWRSLYQVYVLTKNDQSSNLSHVFWSWLSHRWDMRGYRVLWISSISFILFYAKSSSMWLQRLLADCVVQLLVSMGCPLTITCLLIRPWQPSNVH